MGEKLFKKIISPYIQVSTIILLILAAALTYYNTFAGIVAFAGVICILIFFKYTGRDRVNAIDEFTKTISEDMDGATKHFIVQNPFPLCLVDKSGNVLWFNEKFAGIYTQAEMFNSELTHLTDLKIEDFFADGEDGEARAAIVQKDGRIFRVAASYIGETGDGFMLMWSDVTALETLKALYKDEKTCLAYVSVDNYDELINSSPDDRKSIIAAQIERTIRQWAAKHEGVVVRYRSYQYCIIFEQKQFDKMEASKFSVLDEVRSIESDADFPVSLSIGVGVGGKNLTEQESFALAALDLALGRGGDQAVVKKKSKVEYYGGRLQTVEKRNKGKSRIMAHALRQTIDQSSKVIIMGHKNPDMDSLGSAMGVYRFAKNRGKDAAIVIGEHGESVEKLYQAAIENGSYKFITREEAKESADKETLLVIVDTHRPALVECRELLSLTDRRVVIDHHRKAEDWIDNATLTYMEAYASSTSELVTEILQYMGDKKTVEKLEAEALLAGITVDTKNFSVRTGVRTFEAASWLRRNGADTTNVRRLFKTDLDFFRAKAKLIGDAEILPGGIALTWYCGDGVDDLTVLLAQAADDLLNIEGISASFAAGFDKEKTLVSARSLGQINVQVIMEKVGGGGHLTTAGAQMKMPVEEAVAELRQLLIEYAREQAEKSSSGK